MAVTNDYLVPRLNGLPYLDKPLVYFAAQAALMEILGPTELAARLPAYLFTLATAAVLFWFARRRMDEDRALVAVIAYLSMPLTLAFARTVIFDSALAFFITVAIVALHEAVEGRDKRWTLLAWVAIALGVLTKGPVAIVLPLFVAIPYALWRRAFVALWSMAGLIAFVALIAPWVWAVSRVVPGFLEYVVVTETAQRLTTDDLHRTGPPWFFLPYVVAGALPWSLAALASWRGLRSRQPLNVFALLWILVPLAFFSLSQSKQPQYILPLMPGVALLVGHIGPSVRLRPAAFVFGLFGVILLVGLVIPGLSGRMKPEIESPARTFALVLGVMTVACGLVAGIVKRRDAALISLSLPLVLMPITAYPTLTAIAERRSTRGFVADLRPHLAPGTEIIGVKAYTGSLGFYLRRTIVLTSDDASELTSNYLLRSYEKFSGPRGPLRPLSWFRANVEECCARRVYIVRTQAGELQAALESRGMKRIASDARHIAYGPWYGRASPQ